jgi:hypothetical protein
MLAVTARLLYNLAAVLWKRALFQLIIVMGFAALAHRGTAVSLPDRSVSSSRQFIVYGADVPVRGAVCGSTILRKTGAPICECRASSLWMLC